MPDAVHLGSGKVRELYALDDERLLLVASDRISTFDVVLPTAIPDKGRVLTGMSAFWFARTAGICAEPPARAPARRPLHRVPPARDAADRVRGARLPLRLRLEGLRARPARSAATACPPGLRESDRLPEPIFTPATKATSGHDENITRRAGRAALVGAERFAEAERLSIALYRFAAAYALERGIIIADTKFEFGVNRDGRLVLGDEALTPDSSRFWPADAVRAGRAAALVRQAVRARLLREDRLGQDLPGARAAAGRGGGHPPALRGSLRAAHRPLASTRTSRTRPSS